MKLIGLMCVKNEDWVMGASLRAAVQWCDDVILVDNDSSDQTYKLYNEIKGENPWRIQYSRWTDKDEWWDEMDMRHHSLLLGRKHGGTHFAMIDADEILVGHWMPYIRNEIMRLEPREACETKMLAMRELDAFQADDSVWSRAKISLAFADHPELSWKPAVDGYHHHHRLPYGITRTVEVKDRAGVGMPGMMHLQFANKRRLLAKHVLYRMVDHLRWPGRDNPAALNKKFDEALEKPRGLEPLPPKAWTGIERGKIKLDTECWQEWQIQKLLWVHGREAFAGLDLKGY